MNNLYKLIIVDDEFVIREGMASYHWESLGFTVVGTASSGKKALELMEKDPADLIITDIKMPVMDGLDLSRIVREKYPASKVVILTGYKDFEYAKTAINAGVSDYLLKPVDLKKNEDLFFKLRSLIAEEKASSERLTTYEMRLKESIPVAVDNFLSNLLEGKITDSYEIAEKMNLLEIYLNRPFYACAILQLSIPQESQASDLTQATRCSLYDILKEYLLAKDLGYCLPYDTNEFLFLFNFELQSSAQSAFQFLLERIEEIKTIISNFFDSMSKISLTFGIGNIYNNILAASASFQEAREVLEKRFFDECNDTFYAWQDKSIFAKTIYEYPYEKEDLLISSILDGNLEQGVANLQLFWAEIDLIAEQTDALRVKNHILQIFAVLEHKLNIHGTSLEEIIHVVPPFVNYVENFKTLSELKSGVEHAIIEVIQIVNKINSSVKSSSFSAVRQALEYIDVHYNEKISLGDTAEKVYLNPCYFSIQFKKETGKTFVEYIKQLRIQKAKELLKQIDLKIYEVGELVGYQNPRYFSDTFRDFTGMTPIEYRQKIITF